MGLWRISKTGKGGLAVTYINRHSKAEVRCGETPPGQSARGVL